MAITDDIGDVVRDYEYDVYGQVTGGSGSTPNEFGFAGQQSDDSTGLQYLRARYYDLETGVFLSRDPLASGPGWLGNPHGYVDANPANLTDPLGLDGSSVVGGLEQIHPCNWGWFAGKVCSEAEEAIRKLTAGLEDVLARTVAGASLIGEYGKRLATKVAGYSSEWLSDPLNLAALAVAASALAAQLACGAAVASGGVLAGACIAASLLYLEALQYRYELLREAKQEGVITQSQLVCEASTDIAAAVVPGGVLVQSGRIVFGAILCATVPK